MDLIQNAKVQCTAGHPTDVIFLTCDAFGVLPPVASLSPAHAMYHFISGYTAKVAGNEMGVTEPQATFSPCFGGPFLVWHPSKYAELLAEKMRRHNARVWLVNTGGAAAATVPASASASRTPARLLTPSTAGPSQKRRSNAIRCSGLKSLPRCPASLQKSCARAKVGPTNPPTTPPRRSWRGFSTKIWRLTP
jgi:phosphoenolpyruvate carboxykinase (ATP)